MKAGYVTSVRILVWFSSLYQWDPLNQSSGRYRCVDCFGGPILCKSCIVNQHMFNPFHRIQVHQTFFGWSPPLIRVQEWTGTFFRKYDLRSAGQRVQLGHPPGDVCTSPQQSTRTFTVLHTNGMHLADIWFCGCNLAAHHGDRVQQLLRRRIFPATTTDPQTGSTFSLLEFAHILSVQSKLSLYDFYISLEALTDATRVSDVKVCLARFFLATIPL